MPGDYPKDRTELDERAKTAWYRGHSGLNRKILPSVCQLAGYSAPREVEMNIGFRHKVSFLRYLPRADDIAAF